MSTKIFFASVEERKIISREKDRLFCDTGGHWWTKRGGKIDRSKWKNLVFRDLNLRACPYHKDDLEYVFDYMNEETDFGSVELTRKGIFSAFAHLRNHPGRSSIRVQWGTEGEYRQEWAWKFFKQRGHIGD